MVAVGAAGHLAGSPPPRNTHRSIPIATQKYEVTAPNGAIYEVEAPEGATQAEIIARVSTTASQMARKGSKMEPQDEADYRALTQDPETTASDIVAFAHRKGFAVTPEDAQAFIRKRAKKGSRVGDRLTYKSAPGLLPVPPGVIKLADRSPSTARTLAATGVSFLDGVLPDAGRAVAGAGGAMGNTARSALGMEEFDPSLYYQSASNDVRDAKAELKRDHPIVAETAGWTGFGAGFALPGVKVLKGSVPEAVMTKAALRRNATATVVNGSVTGAAYGTVAGGLQGEGSDRIGNAVVGGLAGGTIGAAASPLVNLAVGSAKRVGRVAAPYVAPRVAEGVVERNAQRRIYDSLDGHFTPAEAATEIERRSQAGVPAMPADLTDQSRQLLGHASRGLGPAQSAVREAVAARQANAAPRMQGHVAEALGPTVDPHVQSQTLTDMARADAKPFYDRAYQQPITVTPEIREFMDSPQGRDAINAGVGEIQNTPLARRNVGSETPMQEGILWDPELRAYRSGQVPVTEVFDNAKQHLDNLISDGVNRFVAKAGSTTSNRPAELQRQELLNALDSQNPDYAAARAAYAGPVADRKAFEVGRQEAPGSTRRTVPDAIHQMRGMTESQTGQMRLGDRTRIAEQIGEISVNGDATRPIAGNDVRAALIREIHGPEAADRLQALAAMEKDAHRTYLEAFGNSTSANRNAVDSDMSEEALQAGAYLARGNWKSAASSFLSGVATGRIGRYGQDLKAEMGRVLTDANPSSVSEAMQAIQARADKDASFAASLRNFSLTASKGLAPATIGHSGDRSGMYPDDPE